MEAAFWTVVSALVIAIILWLTKKIKNGLKSVITETVKESTNEICGNIGYILEELKIVREYLCSINGFDEFRNKKLDSKIKEKELQQLIKE